jgi:hypothetical protein
MALPAAFESPQSRPFSIAASQNVVHQIFGLVSNRRTPRRHLHQCFNRARFRVHAQPF